MVNISDEGFARNYRRLPLYRGSWAGLRGVCCLFGYWGVSRCIVIFAALIEETHYKSHQIAITLIFYFPLFHIIIY